MPPRKTTMAKSAVRESPPPTHHPRRSARLKKLADQSMINANNTEKSVGARTTVEPKQLKRRRTDTNRAPATPAAKKGQKRRLVADDSLEEPTPPTRRSGRNKSKSQTTAAVNTSKARQDQRHVQFVLPSYVTTRRGSMRSQTTSEQDEREKKGDDEGTTTTVEPVQHKSQATPSAKAEGGNANRIEDEQVDDGPQGEVQAAPGARPRTLYDTRADILSRLPSSSQSSKKEKDEEELLSSSDEFAFIPITFTVYQRVVRKKERRHNAEPDMRVWGTNPEVPPGNRPSDEQEQSGVVEASWPDSNFMRSAADVDHWHEDDKVHTRRPSPSNDDNNGDNVASSSSVPLKTILRRRL